MESAVNLTVTLMTICEGRERGRIKLSPIYPRTALNHKGNASTISLSTKPSAVLPGTNKCLFSNYRHRVIGGHAGFQFINCRSSPEEKKRGDAPSSERVPQVRSTTFQNSFVVFSKYCPCREATTFTIE